MKFKILVFGFLLMFFFFYSIYQLMYYSDNLFHFVMCDVGQGDGFYIRTPEGSDIVVDGGPDGSVASCLSQHMPFWDRSIEIVFLTHGHSDHVSGLLDVFARYDVEHVVTQTALGEGDVVDAFESAVESEGAAKHEVVDGNVIRASDGVVFEVLWPTEELLESVDDLSDSFDKNLTSLVLLVTYRDFSALLTGDIDANVFNEVFSQSEGDVDVLKIPHQGSKTGVDAQSFVDNRVGLALISVGKNSYGHPHTFVLDMLEEYNIPYYRSDIDGTVEVLSDGVSHRVRK